MRPKYTPRTRCICRGCGQEFFTKASKVKKGWANFCSFTCPGRDAGRFWARVDKSGECWLWTGCTDGHGYGYFYAQRRLRRAHNFAWEIENGPIPDGFEVCHNCPDGDNPTCVRITHLWLGTHAQNMKDRHQKGGYEAITTLTAEIVYAARLCRANGEPLTAFVEKFGWTIYPAVRGDSWKHVPFPTLQHECDTDLTCGEQKDVARR